MEEKYSKPNKIWPSDIIKYNILPYVEPSCEAISNNGKLCSETWEFKTKSGKNAKCSHYCKQHINKWITDIFNTQYQVEIDGKRYNCNQNLHINISGSFLENDVFSFFKQHKINILVKKEFENIKFYVFITSGISIYITDDVEIGNDDISRLPKLLEHFDISEIKIEISTNWLSIENPRDKPMKIYKDDNIISNGWELDLRMTNPRGIHISEGRSYQLIFNKTIYSN